MRAVPAWLSPAVIVLATLVAISAALLSMWWLVVAMALTCVGQLFAIRARRRA